MTFRLCVVSCAYFGRFSQHPRESKKYIENCIVMKIEREILIYFEYHIKMYYMALLNLRYLILLYKNIL